MINFWVALTVVAKSSNTILKTVDGLWIWHVQTARCTRRTMLSLLLFAVFVWGWKPLKCTIFWHGLSRMDVQSSESGKTLSHCLATHFLVASEWLAVTEIEETSSSSWLTGDSGRWRGGSELIIFKGLDGGGLLCNSLPWIMILFKRRIMWKNQTRRKKTNRKMNEMMALPLLTWRSRANRCAKFWLRLELLGAGKTNSEASLRSGDEGTLLVGVPLIIPGTDRNDVKARATFDLLGWGAGGSVKSWESVVARMMRMIKTKHTNTAKTKHPKLVTYPYGSGFRCSFDGGLWWRSFLRYWEKRAAGRVLTKPIVSTKSKWQITTNNLDLYRGHSCRFPRSSIFHLIKLAGGEKCRIETGRLREKWRQFFDVLLLICKFYERNKNYLCFNPTLFFVAVVYPKILV